MTATVLPCSFGRCRVPAGWRVYATGPGGLSDAAWDTVESEHVCGECGSGAGRGAGMSDWRAELERERYTVPSPAPDSSSGPTRQYEQWRRWHSCGAKRRYARRYDARAHVLRLWQQGRTAHEYQCRYGDHWHVTTQPEEQSA